MKIPDNIYNYYKRIMSILLVFPILFIIMAGHTVNASLHEDARKIIEDIKHIPALSNEERMDLSIVASDAVTNSVPYKDIRKIIQDSLKQKQEVTSLVATIKILSDTGKKGLPLLILINKTKEGIAKKMPMKRIEEVVDKKAEVLKDVQRLIRKSKENGLIVKREQKSIINLVDKIERGVPYEYLKQLLLHAAYKRQSIEEVEHISDRLASLIEKGISVDRAKKMIEETMGRENSVELEEKMERRGQAIERKEDARKERLEDIEGKKEERLRKGSKMEH
ncbi:MAG: hypothetical protein AAB296_00035 [Candidatus Desantisbacteria bacterium]